MEDMHNNVPLEGSIQDPAPETTTDLADGKEQPVGEVGQDPVTPQQPQAPAWNPQEYELNYKGQKVYPKDRNHLITLAQQGFGASQQLETLNRRQQEIEQQGQQYAQYSELDKAFKTNPVFAQKIYGLLQEAQQNQQAGVEEQDPRQQQLFQEVETLKQWRSQYLQSEADRQLQQDIEGLKKNHPDHDWDADLDGSGSLTGKILRHAYENGLHNNLALAYKDFMWDSIAVNSKSNALKQHTQQQQMQRKQGIVTSPSSTPVRAPQVPRYNPNDTYESLMEKAKQRL